MKFLILATLITLAISEPVPEPKNRCDKAGNGLSAKYWESVAHAIHSLDLEALRKFNPKAKGDNHIPTVNLNLKASKKVLEDAPSNPIGHDFDTEEMNVIDRVLSAIGKSDDGLGSNWSPLERVAHTFHMRDLWHKIKPVYQVVQVESETCKCLLDIENSGVKSGVAWVANHYAHGTPITLLNRAIPKLTDATTWTTWKNRLLHYYNAEAVRDAAIFLRCAL